MFWYGNHMGGWGVALMTITALLFWALVVAGIVALVRHLGRPPQANTTRVDRPTPEQLLAERFARGEIDDEDYRQRLVTLRGQPSGDG